MFKRHTEPDDSGVNLAVREVATQDTTWRHRQKSDLLYKWADIFNQEFFDGVLPPPVIGFLRTRRERLGHFVSGRNHEGLRFYINLNPVHLNRSDAEILDTLVHEQIHLHQSVTGKASKGNYHNKDFVEKASSIGLKALRGRGCHYGSPGDPFVSLLKRHGVTFEAPDRFRSLVLSRPSDSPQPRLKRWACACRKAVWCGGDLSAICKRCGQDFVLSPTS